MAGVSAGTWVKAIAAGLALCIGGPALVMYVSPTEEELIAKYNPDLQKRARDPELRYKKQKEFDDFVCRLKEASKSKKPIWDRLKEMDAEQAEREAQRKRDEQAAFIAEAERKRAEIRASTQ